MLISHLRTIVGLDFQTRRWTTAIPGNGPLGVSVFFVISGFLITHLLLREQNKSGRISLGGFYMRRFFRIMPAYFSFLGVVVLLRHWHAIAIPTHNLVAAALFITNYFPRPTTEWVGHTWSLSVEEQFYLFWPLTLAVFGRLGAKRMALALLLVTPVIRAISFFAAPHGALFFTRIPFLLHTRVDSLMFGCATALYYSHEGFQRFLRGIFDRKLHWAAFAFLFVVSPYLEVWSEPASKHEVFSQPYLALGGYTVEGACIVLLIVWAVQNVQSPVGRFLNWGPVVHVGLISYSLYLWQQLFLIDPDQAAARLFRIGPSAGLGRLLLAVAVAECSYWVVERTFLKLRERLVGGHRPHLSA